MKKVKIVLLMAVFVIMVGRALAQNPPQFLILPLLDPYASQHITVGWKYPPNFNNGGPHNAIDYGVSSGTPVVAAASGVVSYLLDNQPNNYPSGPPSYGNHIIINHGNGYETISAHLLTGGMKVVDGQTVVQGQLIALSGNSGYSSGAHLHFELRDVSNLPKYDPYGLEEQGLTNYQNNNLDSDHAFADNPPRVIVGLYTDGWHDASSNPNDPSQPFLNAYSENGSYAFFGAPKDNGGGIGAHVWPTGGDPSSQDVVVLQDYGNLKAIALSPGRGKGFYVESPISDFWFGNTGYLNYGAPTTNPETARYIGNTQELGSFPQQITAQKFGKIDPQTGGSIKVIGYKSDAPSTAYYKPLGKLTLQGSQTYEWWIDGDLNGKVVTGDPDDLYLFTLNPGESDWVWADAGNYNIMYIDPVALDTNGIIHVVWEGNNQHIDPVGNQGIQAPVLAAPTINSNSWVDLSWTDANNPDTTPYKIYRDGAEVGETNNSTYIDQTVVFGNTYTYTVAGNGTPNSDPVFIEVTDQGGAGAPAPTGDLRVTYPNGGENLIPEGGYAYNISWNGSDAASVQIELSRDNGSTWTTLIYYANVGSYYWENPGDPASDECLIRITNQQNTAEFDVSDGTFTIGDPNQPPTAQNASVSSIYPNLLTVDLTSYVADLQGSGTIDWGTLTILSSSGGTAAVNGSAIDFTPAYRTSGLYRIDYKVADNKVAYSNVATLTIDVTEGLYANSVAFASNSASIDYSSEVLSGDVIVNAGGSGLNLVAGYQLWLGDRVKTPVGYSIKGDTIKVGYSSTINSDIHYNDLTQATRVNLNGSVFTSLALPVSQVLPVLRIATPGTQDIDVADYATLTLASGSYQDITVGYNATLTLTGGEYHIRNLTADSRADVFFDAVTEVRIKDRLSVGYDATVGPATSSGIVPHDIIFYVEGTNDNIGGQRVNFNANIYAPNSTCIIDYSSFVVGAIIAKDVQIGNRVDLTLDSYFSTDTQLAKRSVSQAITRFESLPSIFTLYQNYPNPFNPTTQIRFDLPEVTKVTVTVFNMLGQKINTLVDRSMLAGEHSIMWQGTNELNNQVSSGIYIYRIQAGNFVQSRKMLLLK